MTARLAVFNVVKVCYLKGKPWERATEKMLNSSLRIKLWFVLSLVAFAGTLTTPLKADEVTMICTFYHKQSYNGKTQTRYLKYENPMFGFKSVSTRVGGDWKNWCQSRRKKTKTSLEIMDRGAVCIQEVQDYTVKKDIPDEDLTKGQEVVKVITYTLDFEFFTRRLDWTWKTNTGRRVLKEDDSWEVWDCRKHSQE